MSWLMVMKYRLFDPYFWTWMICLSLSIERAAHAGYVSEIEARQHYFECSL